MGKVSGGGSAFSDMTLRSDNLKHSWSVVPPSRERRLCQHPGLEVRRLLAGKGTWIRWSQSMGMYAILERRLRCTKRVSLGRMREGFRGTRVARPVSRRQRGDTFPCHARVENTSVVSASTFSSFAPASSSSSDGD